jgi:myo-inositol-1(or 4)-monophosphatase
VNLRSLTDLAATTARSAGEILRGRPARVEEKSRANLVTELDVASEELIRELLVPTGIPIQGEEGGGVTTGTRWAVDPIDGTTNFVHGYPFYCVSIGLIDGDTPVIGVIYDPIRDRLMRGYHGGGAREEATGAPLRVSDTRSLEAALSVTGFPYDRKTNAIGYLGRVQKALEATHGLRRSGSAAMDLAGMATGYADLYWEQKLSPWDTAAGALLVREAGGVVTRIDGGRWTPDAPDILATNGFIHEDAVALFR